LAAVKALVGVMMPVLCITARRMHWGEVEEDNDREEGPTAQVVH
jgi:hypothetical protein